MQPCLDCKQPTYGRLCRACRLLEGLTIDKMCAQCTCLFLPIPLCARACCTLCPFCQDREGRCADCGSTLATMAGALYIELGEKRLLER